MPAIHLFNRRTLSGGDDLHLPGLWGSGLKIIQLFGLLLPIWLNLFAEAQRQGGWSHYLLYDPSSDANCRHSHLFPCLLTAYALSSTIVVAIGLALELYTMKESSKGTPTDPGDRTEKVQSLLEFKLVPFSISEFLVVLLGLSAVIGFGAQYNDCSSDPQANYFWQDFSAYLDGTSEEGRGMASTSQSFYWWWVAYALLLLFQVIEVLVAFFFVQSLLRQEPVIQTSELYTPQHPHPHELAEEAWAERCERFCECLGMSTCFLFGGREMSVGADYGDISRVLADYFETGGVLDLVPSDVTVGFLVLGRIQHKRILEARHAVVSDRMLIDQSSRDQEAPESLLLPLGSTSQPSLDASEQSQASHRFTTTYLMQQAGSQTFYEAQTRRVLSRHKPKDLWTLHEGARFSRYAHAIYGWGLYLFAHPISGVPRLLCNKRGCLFCCHGMLRDDEMLNEETSILVGDNLCQAHKSALLLHARLEDEADLLYAQLKSSFNEVPYCILLDHKWKTVVLAIRGTSSLEDCVTDVLINPEPLDQLGEEFGFDGAGQHCHAGVLSCARIVYRDLQRHKILDRLLTGSNPRFPTYTLRCVGHSLGSATAVLLSLMLRGKFPTLRCVGYSPPGCSLSWKLAIECQEFCSSFVLDCDLVPRLSLNSMEHLRDEVLGLIGRIKVPKIAVVKEVLQGTGCLEGDFEVDGVIIQQSLDKMLYEPDHVPQDSDYQQQLGHFRRIQSERKLQRGESRSIKMFPPGKLVHVMKTGEKTSCFHGIANCVTCYTTNIGSKYTPVWVNNDDLNEVVISPTMGTDHFPSRICAELNGVASDYGIDVAQGTAYCSQEDRVIERA